MDLVFTMDKQSTKQERRKGLNIEIGMSCRKSGQLLTKK